MRRALEALPGVRLMNLNFDEQRIRVSVPKDMAAEKLGDVLKKAGFLVRHKRPLLLKIKK